MTLTDVLTRAAAEKPGQGVVHVGDTVRFTGHAELLADALRIGGGLHGAGIGAGDTVMVVADDSADFLGLFWGAVVAGAVPVPLPPEPRRLAAVWRHLGHPPIAGDTATPGATLLSPRALRSVLPLTTPVPVRPDDLAFLQFSSGSTGAPKGVELTHANVVANLDQATRAGQLSGADVFVTWMPYFHDMGLIGTHLAPLYVRCRQVRIPPLAFARRPETWLRAAAEHRGTVLSAAGFALPLVNRRVPDDVLDTLDLSSVRLLMVGAEPVSPSAWRAFAHRLTTRSRLAPGAMQPVYGLAEATVAVACPPLGELAVPLRLSRAALARGVAVPAMPAEPMEPAVPAVPPGVAGTAAPSAVELMDVGYPVPGCELRIVDDQGLPLEDGLVGHVQVRGPNVARGYHRDPAATAEARDGAWLRTGDIGFLRAGRLCVTGRHKDVLFVNGRNLHAADLEEVAAATPGLGSGPIAVVGATDPASGRERIAVFLSAPAVRADPAGLTEAVRARIAEASAYDDVTAEVLPTGAFARTTSGKLRRQALRDRLSALSLGQAAPSSAVPSPSRAEASFAVPMPSHVEAVSSSVEPRASVASVSRTEAVTTAPPPSPAPGAVSALSRAPMGRLEVETVVREVWARVLRVPAESIRMHDRFPAIGGSSLTAMEVLMELEEACGRTLDPSLLRDCATVPEIADRLLALGAHPDHRPPIAPAGAEERQRGTGGSGGRGQVAIIGMACRFPDADTPERFWANLVAGRDSVAAVTRWPGGGFGAFLDDPAQFDAGYFGIGDEEARLLDPHARIFLELAHEALERAGYAGPRRRAKRIGIFAAVGESGHPELVTRVRGGTPTDGHALTGGLRNLIAARVSHLLDLTGPALAVDTACSSALVAVHLARRSLEAGDCDIAVVGGVSLNVTATGEALLRDARALSPTGRCRAFDADADGFVPGEGGAALVLTRLADAGGDRVLAVIRGTAVNNDGRSLSLMAPNPLLQQQVIADAYRDGGVDPADVTYVEAHGTGTAIGDPIEARSLAYAFGPRPGGVPRLLGSVKTNIGHLLNVAGLPALVKVVLALHHRELPPSLHYHRPSPRFDLAAAGFEVITERRAWAGPYVAGVNGFGFGGTNAHVILAAPPTPGPGARRQPGPHLLTLSARSAVALRAAADQLADRLRAHSGLPVADVCATVAAARDEGPYRIALVTGNDLAAQLAVASPGTAVERPARVAFLFGGQGTQRPGQGAGLYETAPEFRAVLDEVSAAAGPIRGRTLAEWCTDPRVSVADLARTEVTQPLMVAFGVAQAAQLAAYGIRPAAVAGHSIGELAAAVTAGRLTAVDAVLLAAERGRLTARLTAPGAMLAVAGSSAEVAEIISGEVTVAAENAPDRIVLAGSVEAISRAASRLTARGVSNRRLAVPHAFHSPAMQTVSGALGRLAPAYRPETIPMLSTVTGAWNPSFDASYLAAHAVGPVRFAAAVAGLRAAGFDTMVEMGGSGTLSAFVRRTARLPEPSGTSSAPPEVIAQPAGADAAALLATAGALWSRGAPLDRARLDHGTRRVDVPTYPFQRRRFWIGDPPRPALSVPDWTDAPLPPSSPAAVVEGRETAGESAVVVTVVTAGPGDAAAALAAIAAAPADGALLIVTRDLWATGVGRPDARHAVWAGLGMAFADENPRAGVRIVDLCSADPEEDRRAAVRREIAVPPPAGPAELVAWRGGRRLSRSFTPATGGEPLVPPPDGSYLLVGGAGAAAAAIARHLARRGRPRLLLAGRSAEPVALLRELRDLGALVEYRVADVTVARDVHELLAGRDFDVVVQAAGVVRPGSLRRKTAAEVEAGIAAKVRGTTLLIEALGDRRPLVVALSSISAALPGLAGAVGDYVAGNVFLDAVAAAQRAAGRPFVSVGLPALLGGGLAAAHGEARNGLPIEQLPETLWAAAGQGVAQVLVTPSPQPSGDPRRPLLIGTNVETSAAKPAGFPPSPAYGRPRSEAAPGAVAGGAGREAGPAELIAVVRELLAGPVGREPSGIGLDELFLVMGLDSLTAVDLVKELEQRLGRELPTTLFFECRTIGELAARLEAQPVVSPLSPVQRAFVTTGRLHPETRSYAYVRQTLRGPVHAERLASAFAELERRHPMLRARLGPAGQRIEAPGDGWPRWFTVVDRTPPSDPAAEAARPERATGTAAATEERDAGAPDAAAPDAAARDASAGIAELDSELRNLPFDLEREAPIRAVLATAGADVAHLVVVAHHAAADGFSLAILGDELWALYRGELPAAAPEATFPDHEAGRLAASTTDLDYWRSELAGYPRLALPFDGDAGEEPRGPYGVHQRVLSAEASRALTAQARQAGVSVFHLLLAGYVRCLARWSGQDAVPVTVARAGRQARLPGVERMVGPFADTLPVLAEVRAAEPVAELAARLRDRWLDAERHGSVSTVDLARMLAADQAGPRTASPAGFSFARFPATGGIGANVLATTAGTASAATRLGLLCFEAHGTLHFSWNYPEALFRRATVERLAEEHLAEIAALAGGMGTPVAERIRRQARRTPDGVAVLTDGVPLTYREMDRASDRLAARLTAIDQREPGRIGLLTRPGAATVIGLVGILKASAAWVPVDAAHPPARLASQLRRAGAGIVVCDAGTRAAAEALRREPDGLGGDGLGGDGLTVGGDGLTLVDSGFTLVDVGEAGTGAPPPVRTGPDDTAYVIFTSGSTGRPKGVAVSHRAMMNYLDWAIETFGYHAGDRLAQTASICFDASVRQLLAPLLAGATVVAWDRDTVRDPELLVTRLERDRVTVWSSVPSLWERVLAAAEKSRPGLPLRWVHVGGEELSPAHVRRWFDLFGPGQRITNLYGPTETTINATWHLITARPGDDVDRLPIGRPIGGAVVDVIDGEIYIGGAGLADGYLDDPEQTAATFVERDGRRWYRSGDLGHRDADGVLWFRGRVDDQVKLHGYRVEPGEVEAVLRQHPAVERAIVLAGGGRLAAWAQSPSVDAAALRAHLTAVLPDYLVPARITVVAELPLTPTGKIDRASLTAARMAAPAAGGGAALDAGQRAEPATGQRAVLDAGQRAEPAAGQEAEAAAVSEGAPPVSATERLLAELWRQLLDVPEIGRDDDFFASGGDSIAVLELFSRLSEHRTVLPRPTVLYRRRTIAALAEAIDTFRPEPPDESGAPGDEYGDEYGVSLTQRGFLLADAVGTASTWLAAPRLRGPLDPQRFQHAVDVLVERHPMVRTVFPAGARPPVQREIRSARLIVGYEPEPLPLDAELAAERAHRFDPARWPLVRLRLLRYGPDEHALLCHAHHLVGDGYSVALLMRELLAAYDGNPLPPLRSTFRDYVALLDGLTPEIAPHDGATMLGLTPETTPRDGGTMLAGGGTTEVAPGGGTAGAGFTIGPVDVAALRERAVAAGVTPFVPVLDAFRRALAAVTGSPDPVIGVAVTGRDHALPDVGRIFGPCATAVAVRPGSAAGLAEVAKAVTEARGRTFTAPYGWRYFFTYLDFGSLGSARGATLELTRDDVDAELGVPPGTEILLAVRPVEGGLRMTWRGRVPSGQLIRLAAELADLTTTTTTSTAATTTASDAEPATIAEEEGRTARRAVGSARRDGVDARLDAGLVGYLPGPEQLSGLAVGLPEDIRRMLPGLDRETLRALLFPDGGPRLLEIVDTPLGRSGFVALPWFADELGAAGAVPGSGRPVRGAADMGSGRAGAVPGQAGAVSGRAGLASGRGGLAEEVAAAVEFAAGLGARTVSLAGMIPAYTGYGAAVTPYLRNEVGLTSGHAVTAAAVVRTALAALAARGRRIEDSVVAFLGVGSIGTSSLRLLLARAGETPAGLILCDLPSASARLAELAAEIGASVEADVYRADLIIAATSGGPSTLDVDRLRPGTMVVDDSFPHCFDTARALARMRDRGDVLITGGGLLDCGPLTNTIMPGLPSITAGLPGAIASCRLESLLHAATPGLPLVTGPVEPVQAAAYWDALDAAGVRPAPLHLLDRRLDAL